LEKLAEGKEGKRGKELASDNKSSEKFKGPLSSEKKGVLLIREGDGSPSEKMHRSLNIWQNLRNKRKARRKSQVIESEQDVDIRGPCSIFRGATKSRRKGYIELS